MLLCPLCQAALIKQHHSWRCSNSHSFDIAKEGYCHLLPVQQKRSKMPGDNKAMIKARQLFLHQGHYQFLAAKLSMLANQVTQSTASLLDLGCGEGYYGHYLQQHAQHPLNYVGIDISKEAIKLAAKQKQGLSGQYFVASSQRLPIDNASIDLGLRIFAPSNVDELQRTIKKDGHLITVRPGSHHLSELKQHIYQELKLHQETAEGLQGFSHIKQEKLSQIESLTTEQVEQLCMMTPFAWRKGERLATALQQQSQHEMHFEFVIDLYQRA